MENSSFEQAAAHAERSSYREMSGQERSEVMGAMRDNFASQSEPKVGIFWYDEDNDDLFGVSKVNADELQYNSNGLKTIKTLHKSWWQAQKNKALSRGKDPGVFRKDYTRVPRGQIFQRKDGVFQLMCGSWINGHIVELVKEEFDLQNVPFEEVVDEHWEIGHGWSEDYP